MFIPEQNVQTFSRFPCKASEYRWLKVHPNDEFCPNMTLLCAILRVTGPLHEKTLCIVTLSLQVVCSAVAFYIRYFLLEN